MAPVATEPARADSNSSALKAKLAKAEDVKAVNPFYSPPEGDDGNDDYEYANYKVKYPYEHSCRVTRLTNSACSISLISRS